MKKFLITSENYHGEIAVLYKEKEDFHQLMMIDFLQADLNDEQVTYFNHKIPSKVKHWDEVLAAFGSTKLVFTSSNFQVSFEAFWRKYDRKINKIRCEKIWEKMSLAARADAYVGLTKYLHHLQLNAWKSRADPETYLKNRYWENEWK